MLLTVFELSLVSTSICPSLNSGAMLTVLFPFPDVLPTVNTLVNAISVSFIVGPLSLVVIAIGINEAAPPVC